MAIDIDLNTKEGQKFVESQSVPGKPVVSVSNPDGSDITTELSLLIYTLQELIQRLAPLGGAMATNATVRTSGIGTFAVSGPATSAQVVAALLTQTNTLWINNLTAINSNINNVVVTT